MYTVLITCVGGDLAPQMIQQLKNSKRQIKEIKDSSISSYRLKIFFSNKNIAANERLRITGV